jgi:hypothetical protein
MKGGGRFSGKGSLVSVRPIRRRAPAWHQLYRGLARLADNLIAALREWKRVFRNSLRTAFRQFVLRACESWRSHYRRQVKGSAEDWLKLDIGPRRDWVRRPPQSEWR